MRLVLALVLYICAGSVVGQSKPVSINITVGRNAPITKWNLERRTFSAGIIVSYKLSKKVSLNTGIVKNFSSSPPALQTRLVFRVY